MTSIAAKRHCQHCIVLQSLSALYCPAVIVSAALSCSHCQRCIVLQSLPALHCPATRAASASQRQRLAPLLPPLQVYKLCSGGAACITPFRLKVLADFGAGVIEVAALPGDALRRWQLLKDGNQRLVAN